MKWTQGHPALCWLSLSCTPCASQSRSCHSNTALGNARDRGQRPHLLCPECRLLLANLGQTEINIVFYFLEEPRRLLDLCWNPHSFWAQGAAALSHHNVWLHPMLSTNADGKVPQQRKHWTPGRAELMGWPQSNAGNIWGLLPHRCRLYSHLQGRIIFIFIYQEIFYWALAMYLPFFSNMCQSIPVMMVVGGAMG